MRQMRFNISTGVVEVNYPDTMTRDDVQDFKDQMAITFRILDRNSTSNDVLGRERTRCVDIAESLGAKNVADAIAMRAEMTSTLRQGQQ